MYIILTFVNMLVNQNSLSEHNGVDHVLNISRGREANGIFFTGGGKELKTILVEPPQHFLKTSMTGKCGGTTLITVFGSSARVFISIHFTIKHTLWHCLRHY